MSDIENYQQGNVKEIYVKVSHGFVNKCLFRRDFFAINDNLEHVHIRAVDENAPIPVAACYLDDSFTIPRDCLKSAFNNAHWFMNKDYYANRLTILQALDHMEENEPYKEYYLVKGNKNIYLFKGFSSNVWKSQPVISLIENDEYPKHYALLDQVESFEAVRFKMSPSMNISIIDVGCYLIGSDVPEDVVTQVFIEEHRNM